MYNLIPLKSSTIDEFDLIHKSKNNPTKLLLTNARPELVKRYSLFDKEFSNNTLENIIEVKYVRKTRDAMLHCYKKTNARNSLMVRIKITQKPHLIALCQYCGLNSNDTIDHYLPKENYPEYSVNHLNLLPCCGRCNTLKGAEWIEKSTNSRTIINLYTDQLPKTQFLFLKVDFFKGVPIPSFSLKNPNGINSLLFSRLENHFRILKLTERYVDMFNSTYLQVRSAFSSNTYKGNGNLIKLSLLADSESLFLDYGRNYYVAIVKQSLAENKEFLDSF